MKYTASYLINVITYESGSTNVFIVDIKEREFDAKHLFKKLNFTISTKVF